MRQCPRHHSTSQPLSLHFLAHVQKHAAHTQDLTTPERILCVCCTSSSSSSSLYEGEGERGEMEEEKSYGITIYYIFFLTSKCVKSVYGARVSVCVWMLMLD
jgi:hypothetical protein